MQPVSVPAAPQRHFHSQRPNEIVLRETRRHWWSWVRWLPVCALMVAAGIGLAALLPALGGLFIVIGLVFALAFGLYLYAEWINDSIFITDQRIVRIMRNLLRFSNQVSEIPLASIQEIQADIPNWDIFALTFKYGYIAFRTSGQAGDVRMHMIPDPDGLQDLILMDMRQHRAMMNSSEKDDIRRNVERMIEANNAVQAFAAPPRPTASQPVRAPWSPFISRYPGEDGAIIFRRHWYVWVKKVWLPLLVLIGAVVALVATQAAGLGVIGLAISFVVFVIGFAWFLWEDTDWRNDYMIVNDNTITMLHQRPLWLQNERDVLLLKRVDNIVAESQGLANQLLNKGTLRFALIGSSDYKTFIDIYNPLDAQAELARRQGRARQQAAAEAQEQQQQVVAQYIQAYHEMMEQKGMMPAPAAFSPMPTAQQAAVPGMPESPRPALTQGRVYQPYNPVQPPPFQMPQATQPLMPPAYTPPVAPPPVPPAPPAAPDTPPDQPPPPLFPLPR